MVNRSDIKNLASLTLATMPVFERLQEADRAGTGITLTHAEQATLGDLVGELMFFTEEYITFMESFGAFHL